jgi:hypothetical protein
MDRRLFFGEKSMSVCLALEDTADRLTSRDLLRIANQAGGAVRISPGPWLVLVDVPEIHYRKIAAALRSIGYRCNIFSGEMKELSTFILMGKGGKRYAT